VSAKVLLHVTTADERVATYTICKGGDWRYATNPDRIVIRPTGGMLANDGRPQARVEVPLRNVSAVYVEPLTDATEATP